MFMNEERANKLKCKIVIENSNCCMSYEADEILN